MSNELELFLERLVKQNTIMQQTADLILMLHSRDMNRNIQSAEIEAIKRGKFQAEREEHNRMLRSAYSVDWGVKNNA